MEDRKDDFLILCAMAKADGELHDNEMSLLLTFADRWKIPEEEAMRLIENAPGSVDGLRLPDAENRRKKLFNHLMQMARGDNRFSPEEQAIIEQLGPELGVWKKKPKRKKKKKWPPWLLPAALATGALIALTVWYLTSS